MPSASQQQNQNASSLLDPVEQRVGQPLAPNQHTTASPSPVPSPSQTQEEEEIVAQVSSLINNMDLNQQNRLMS